MKKVAVLFSGGLDSTYLVWKNLKDGNQVYPIYIEIKNNETKTILEKNRIELLFKEFSKEFDSSVHDIQYTASVGVNAREDSLYFKQMPIWLFSLMFMQSMNIDEIQIGYVSNDDAISYIKDIQKIYKSYQSICEPMKPLVFPLTKFKKWSIFEELPEQYRKLIISCESAQIISDDDEIIQYEPCCECGACRTIIATDYYGVGVYPLNYHNNLVRHHANQLRKFDYNIIDKDGVDYYEKMCKLAPRKEPYQLYIDFDCLEEREECITEKEYNG